MEPKKIAGIVKVRVGPYLSKFIELFSRTLQQVKDVLLPFVELEFLVFKEFLRNLWTRKDEKAYKLGQGDYLENY